MFERYTEKARRVIFFARYEASQFGSPEIDAEHILLGLLRDDKKLFSRWLPKVEMEVVRQRIESWTKVRPIISTSIDLPLSRTAKRALNNAKDEADRLKSKYIGTQHLLLALLDDADSSTAKLLRELGADSQTLRNEFGQLAQDETLSSGELARQQLRSSASSEIIAIHGEKLPARIILKIVGEFRQWHWRKQRLFARDTVKDRKTGKISFDLALAEDSANFELLKGGWKKDHCVICQWELFESNDDESRRTGYSNGRDWLCTECYEKFWEQQDIVGSSYSDIT